jgi:hypothetical protein
MMTTMTEDWLSPLNRILIQRAVRNKQSSVTLRDGRKFDLDYDKRKSENMVQIKPHKQAGTFVPMGFFDIKRLTDSSWLSEANNEKK